MTDRSDPDVHKIRAAQNPLVEIPPQQNRKHLTEPSWIEHMIYLAGVYLGQEAAVAEESEETREGEPAKSKAA